MEMDHRIVNVQLLSVTTNRIVMSGVFVAFVLLSMVLSAAVVASCWAVVISAGNYIIAHVSLTLHSRYA